MEDAAVDRTSQSGFLGWALRGSAAALPGCGSVMQLWICGSDGMGELQTDHGLIPLTSGRFDVSDATLKEGMGFAVARTENSSSVSKI